MGVRKFLIQNTDGYGEGYYGEGYYGGYTEVLIDNTWTFTKSINSQKTCKFKIISNPNNATISKGLTVVLLDDNVTIFSGIIRTIEKVEEIPGELFYNIDCYTNEKLASKRRIGLVFENRTAGYIFRYIANNYLLDEGITIGAIHEGQTFERVVFNYSTITEAFNLIQNSTQGYNWHIDNEKKLYFLAKATIKSNYTINDTFQHSGMKESSTLDEYRNTMFVNGGLRLVNEITGWIPSPKPDGSSRDFIVKYPIGKEPTIYINSVAVPASDVGVNGFDENKKWYWSYNSDKITQDTSETVLSITDVLTIDFEGLLQTKVKIDDINKINERADIEGNTGIYEEITENKDLTSLKTATDYGNALIEKYNDQACIEMTIEDDIKDFDINMLVKIDRPLFGINSWYLIESITATPQTGEHIKYTVKMLSGEFVGNWEDYLKSLLTQKYDINADDTIIQYQSFAERFYQSGQIEFNAIGLLAPSLTLQPSIYLAPGISLHNEYVYEGYTIPSSYYDYETKIATQDTYVNSYYPDSNFNSQDKLKSYWGGLPEFYVILLDFDLSDITGKTIVSATLKLYSKSAFSGNLYNSVRLITSSWDETTATYNNSISSIGSIQYDYKKHSTMTASQPITWNVTTLLQNIASGLITNYNGLALYPYSPDYTSQEFYKRDVYFYKPKLEITYLKS
jgi:hypothetical protein